MVPPANARLLRARRAADALAQRLSAHPSVAMVDVGPEPSGHEIAIRVHVRRGAIDPSLPEVPGEFDGFPVTTIPTEYGLNEEP
jgi:hypothetical protein